MEEYYDSDNESDPWCSSDPWLNGKTFMTTALTHAKPTMAPTPTISDFLPLSTTQNEGACTARLPKSTPVCGNIAERFLNHQKQ